MSFIKQVSCYSIYIIRVNAFTLASRIHHEWCLGTMLRFLKVQTCTDITTILLKCVCSHFKDWRGGHTLKVLSIVVQRTSYSSQCSLAVLLEVKLGFQPWYTVQRAIVKNVVKADCLNLDLSSTKHYLHTLGQVVSLPVTQFPVKW